MQLENGVWAWANTPERYVKELVTNVEKFSDELAHVRWQFPNKKAANLFIRDYTLDMDETPALEHALASWYQSLIGILRWMLEICGVDIITEVSIMESQMDMPREGQFEAVLHVFVFIRQQYNSRMEFDPNYPVIDMNDFKECKCKNFMGV